MGGRLVHHNGHDEGHNEHDGSAPETAYRGPLPAIDLLRLPDGSRGSAGPVVPVVNPLWSL
ncbi:MAG: hypothetical protein RJA14_1007 [Pseudomonadota bacterium]|jgi:hypothetical protein